MKKIDSIYLDDIIEAINKCDQFIDNLNFLDFSEDEKTQFAVFHALEVIGEAANKLSSDFVSKHPNLPIKEAVEMRNFLIHGYDQIDLKIVWITIDEYLPGFKRQIEEIIEK